MENEQERNEKEEQYANDYSQLYDDNLSDYWYFARGVLPDNPYASNRMFVADNLNAEGVKYRVSRDKHVSLSRVFAPYEEVDGLINDCFRVECWNIKKNKGYPFDKYGQIRKDKEVCYKILIHNSKLIFAEKV